MRPPALRPGLLVTLLNHIQSTKRPPMRDTPDPANPNAAHFAKPHFVPRPRMRELTQSQKVRSAQAHHATVNPARITLPELPEALRTPAEKRP